MRGHRPLRGLTVVRTASLTVLAAALVVTGASRYRVERLPTQQECFGRSWTSVVAADTHNASAAAARACGWRDPLNGARP